MPDSINIMVYPRSVSTFAALQRPAKPGEEGGNDGENKIGMDRRQITCLQIRDIAELTDGRIDAIAKLRIHFSGILSARETVMALTPTNSATSVRVILPVPLRRFSFGLPSASKLFTKITNRLKNKI